MKVLEPYYRINEAAGLSIHILQDGTYRMDCCRLTARGNQLEIAEKMPDISSLDRLPREAIALNLSGKGILHKQIEGTEAIGPGTFNKILPNASIDDFYVQQFISGGMSFVSVIRRLEADRWINLLRQQGFLPLMLSLGPFPATHILPQLNIYGEKLRFNGHVIQINEQKQWINYSYAESAMAPFALKVESETIDEKLIIPYAAAFQLILASRLGPIRAEVPVLEQAFRNKLIDIKLKMNSILVLAVFFVLLMVNFTLLSSLDSSNADLSSQVSRLTQNTNNSQDIEAQIKIKEQLLQRLGWDGGLNKSALIDQLASLMPEEITLNEIAINPVDLNSSRAQRALVFFNRRISITGTSDQIIPVNEWLARIKTKPWAKNIQLESYTYNSELNTGQFTLTLNY